MISKCLIYLLLINFINLSANFYQASEINSRLLIGSDPLDSLTEMVLEYFLEMNDDTIPDTEIPSEERSVLDIKMVEPPKGWMSDFSFKEAFLVQSKFSHTDFIRTIATDVISPPPKFRA